jgi:hypothetical protein
MTSLDVRGMLRGLIGYPGQRSQTPSKEIRADSCGECEGRGGEVVASWCRSCQQLEYLFCANCLGYMAFVQEEDWPTGAEC